MSKILTLIGNIERIDHVKGAIKSVRSSLPDEPPEAERKSVKNGSQAILKCKNAAIFRGTHVGYSTPILPQTNNERR